MADPNAPQSLAWPILGAQIMSTVLTAGGQMQRGNTAVAVGQRTNLEDQFQAQQLQQNAGQEMASGEASAQSQNLQTGYIVSQALARAAASGGGTSDPTVVNNIAMLQGMGQQRAAIDRYNASSQARTMNLRAGALQFEGQQAQEDAAAAKRASDLSGFTTVLSGVAKTMAEKYQVGM